MPEYPVLAREHTLTRRGAERKADLFDVIGRQICSPYRLDYRLVFRRRCLLLGWTIELVAGRRPR